MDHLRSMSKHAPLAGSVATWDTWGAGFVPLSLALGMSLTLSGAAILHAFHPSPGQPMPLWLVAMAVLTFVSFSLRLPLAELFRVLSPRERMLVFLSYVLAAILPSMTLGNASHWTYAVLAPSLLLYLFAVDRRSTDRVWALAIAMMVGVTTHPAGQTRVISYLTLPLLAVLIAASWLMRATFACDDYRRRPTIPWTLAMRQLCLPAVIVMTAAIFAHQQVSGTGTSLFPSLQFSLDGLPQDRVQRRPEDVWTILRNLVYLAVSVAALVYAIKKLKDLLTKRTSTALNITMQISPMAAEVGSSATGTRRADPSGARARIMAAYASVARRLPNGAKGKGRFAWQTARDLQRTSHDSLGALDSLDELTDRFEQARYASESELNEADVASFQRVAEQVSSELNRR